MRTWVHAYMGAHTLFHAHLLTNSFNQARAYSDERFFFFKFFRLFSKPYPGDLHVQFFLDQARCGRPTHFLRGAALSSPADRAASERIQFFVFL